MLEWNVYYHSSDGDKIETHNVFNHWRFHNDLCSLVKEYKNKEEFDRELRRCMMYYYWSKCEWEILVSPWIGSNKSKSIKIDVYDQVKNNWNIFVDYVWNNRDKLDMETPL